MANEDGILKMLHVEDRQNLGSLWLKGSLFMTIMLVCFCLAELFVHSCDVTPFTWEGKDSYSLMAEGETQVFL